MSLTLAPTDWPLSAALARLRNSAAAIAAHQQGRFAPWLAVALGAGVLGYFALPEEPGQGALWAVAPLLAVALWLGARAPLAGWALGMGGAALLGFGIAGWHAARLPPPLDLPRTAIVLTGTVREVEALPEGLRITVSAVRLGDSEALPRDLRIRLRNSDRGRPSPGDSVRLRALLHPPAPPVVPDGWDFQRASYFSGLGGTGFALGPVEILRRNGSETGFASLRASLDRAVQGAIPGPAGAVSAALLTGSQAGIAPEAMAAMRDSGLAHLLSVSGLHMTIVVGTSFAVLRLAIALLPWLALRVPGKAIAASGGLAAGLGYTMLTGAQVPVQRSLLMAALVTLALVVGRRALTTRSLALAASVVLLTAPAELLGPSFQMSFAAVLALTAGWEVLRFRLPGSGWGRRIALAVFGLLVTSLLAGAATAPFGLHHFGRLQIYGVAANAVAVPLTSFLVMPAGMLALALMPFGLEQPALWAMGQGSEAVLGVARFVAAWPQASPVLPPLPGPALAAASLGFCWLCLWRGGVRLLGVPGTVLPLAFGLMQAPPHLLIATDGRLVGLRTEAGVFLQEWPGATAFARNAVLRRLGAAQARPLPPNGEEAGGALSCTAAACRFRPHPEAGEVVLFRTAPPARGARRGEPPDATTLAAHCGRAALLVATEPFRPRCAGSASIDRFTLWREGAIAVRLGTHGAEILSERAWRGQRPWVPPPPIPGRPESLPLAPVDGP